MFNDEVGELIKKLKQKRYNTKKIKELIGFHFDQVEETRINKALKKYL